MFQKKSDEAQKNSAQGPNPFTGTPGGQSHFFKAEPESEELAVHTMEDDLKKAKEPQLEKGATIRITSHQPEIAPKPKAMPKPEIAPRPKMMPRPETTPNREMTPKPAIKLESKPAGGGKANPFLTQENWDKKESWGKKEDIYLKNGKNEPQAKRGLGKVIFFAMVIAIFLVVAVGGYYFWMTRMDGKTDGLGLFGVKIAPEESMPEQDEESEALPALPTFSESGGNYLILDMESADPSRIKETLKIYADQIYAAKIVAPVEFIATDSGNNPVVFSDFAQVLGLELDQSVMSQLGSAFNLYFYIDNGAVKIGISVASLEDALLEAAMAQNEKNLPRALEPFYLVSAYELGDAVFNSSEYEGKNVRYYNIVSPEELSVDYVVREGKLFIGTTRMTLQAILDYASQKEMTMTENLKANMAEETAGGEALQPVEDNMEGAELNNEMNSGEEEFGLEAEL